MNVTRGHLEILEWAVYSDEAMKRDPDHVRALRAMTQGSWFRDRWRREPAFRLALWIWWEGYEGRRLRECHECGEWQWLEGGEVTCACPSVRKLL